MKNFYREVDFTTSQSITRRFIDAIATDSVINPTLKSLVSEENYAALVNAEITYNDDSKIVDLIAERQILAFFAKNADLPLKVDREAVAFNKFVESEVSCREANRRIKGWRRDYQNDSYVESIMLMAQRKIAAILCPADFVGNPIPGLSDLSLSFGPGSNVNVKKNTSARWKLSALPACSADMLAILPDVLAELPCMSDFWCTKQDDESWTVPVVVNVGELMFVAKNAKTDRSIIVEPSLNTMVQKGIGSVLKDRLLLCGINLFDQGLGKQSNRERARRASINNDLCTVDLSSASDCISTELVRDLLPPDWYSLLESCRTSRVQYRKTGQVFDLQKFSSMGNGFTFELESLIFYALTWAVCKFEGVIPDISVYGDDIICPKGIFPSLNYVFTTVGFKINDSKSFVDGPFRESCGGDYFLGQDVRPFYQKSNWSEATLYSFHNFLVRKNLQFIFPTLCRASEDVLHSPSKIFGPDGYGDGHLIGIHPQLVHKKKHGWSGYVFDTRSQKPLKLQGYLLPGDYILPFYSAYVGSGGGNHFAIRGSSKKVRLVRIYTLGRN